MEPNSQTRLRELLEQVHAELEHTQTVDPVSRELLEHLTRDIQTALAQSEYGALNNPVENAVERLEDSHPQLTLILKQLLDHLAAV